MELEIKKPSSTKAALEAETTKRSAARERLDAARATRGDIIERVTLDGEEWFIKRLSWPEITRVKLAIPRDAKGVLNLSQEDHLRGITVAMLATSVMDSADAQTAKRYFTNAEAVEYVDEPTMLGLVTRLFAAITDINPDVLPNSPAGRSKPKPGAASRASTPSSPNTQNSESPVGLPTGATN